MVSVKVLREYVCKDKTSLQMLYWKGREGNEDYGTDEKTATDWEYKYSMYRVRAGKDERKR